MTEITYTDTMTTLTWFAIFLIVVTLIGLLLWALAGRIESAYMATLMELQERERRRHGR